MTVIEFFDRESAVENIVSTLLCKPEKVVFIGSDFKAMRRSIEKYKAVVSGRGLNVEFEARSVQKNNLMATVGLIEDIVGENKDCVVDLSGGDDLCLVAVGIVYADRADELKLHRFNVSNGSMTDCDSDGIVCACGEMKLSIEECISIYGGKVNELSDSYKWDYSEEFKNDVRSMWSVCKKNPTEWNAQIKILDKVCSGYLGKDGLSVSVKPSVFESPDVKTSKKLLETLGDLNRCGVLREFVCSDSKVSFVFKNSRIKRALSKSGQVLELAVTVAALDAKNKNGEPIYDEVLTGVSVDWEEENASVSNEIDVVLMKGMLPVFVSCKNGSVSVDELYKLSSVAERFGGKFAKKALVATELEKLGSKEAYIKARAESLDIKIIDCADTLSDSEFQRKIRNLYI